MGVQKGLRQLAFVVGEQTVRSSAAFVISILLARATSTEEYGVYTFLAPVLIIILGIQNGLTSIPYVTLVVGVDVVRRKEFLGNVLVFHGLVSLLILFFLLFLAFVQQYVRFLPVPADIICLYSGVVVSWLLRDFMRQVLLASLSVVQMFFYGLAVNGGTLLLVLYLYTTGQLSISSTYMVLIVTSLIPTCVLLVQKGGDMSFSLAGLTSDMRECFLIGKWLAGRALLGVVSGPTMLNAQLIAGGDVLGVALYGVCMIPSSILAPLTQALPSFLVPKMSHAHMKGVVFVRDMVSKLTLYLAVILVFFNGVIFFSCDILMEIGFSGKYQVSPWLLLLFTLQMSALVLAIPVNSALIAMKDTKAGFVGEVIASIVIVVFGILLARYWGIWGFAVSLLISCIANRGYQVFVYQKMNRG